MCLQLFEDPGQNKGHRQIEYTSNHERRHVELTLDDGARYTQQMLVLYSGGVVESGATEAVFARMAHPYTRALLQARPRLDAARGSLLPTIPGQVPDLFAAPAGCRFADRCKYATAACKKAQKMREVTPGHFIRCCRFDPPQSNT